MRRFAVLAVPALLLIGAGCGDDDDAGGGQAFCDRARSFDAEFDAIEEELDGDEVPTSASFSDAADLISDFADDAPSEIESDVEAMADAMREVAGDMEALDLDADPEWLTEQERQEMIEAGDRIGEVLEGMEESSENIAAYLEEECGISSDE